MRSRLVFLKKKDGVKPRPIRVGEVLKRIVSKRSVLTIREKLRTLMQQMRQWGVGIPGGCESLVHFRSVVESAARSGAIEPIICLDIDLENCFCTLEWDEMRGDLDKHLPDVLPWIAWQQHKPSTVVLPSGDQLDVDRGAEQGEPLGALQTAVMIGSASAETHAGSTADSAVDARERAAVDHWFIDDG